MSNSTVVGQMKVSRSLPLSILLYSPHHSDSISWGLWTPVVFPFRVFHVKYISLRFLFSVCIFVILDLLHPHTYTSRPVVAGYDPNKYFQINLCSCLIHDPAKIQDDIIYQRLN